MQPVPEIHSGYSSCQEGSGQELFQRWKRQQHLHFYLHTSISGELLMATCDLHRKEDAVKQHTPLPAQNCAVQDGVMVFPPVNLLQVRQTARALQRRV